MIWLHSLLFVPWRICIRYKVIDIERKRYRNREKEIYNNNNNCNNKINDIYIHKYIYYQYCILHPQLKLPNIHYIYIHTNKYIIITIYRIIIIVVLLPTLITMTIIIIIVTGILLEYTYISFKQCINLSFIQAL